MSDTSTLNSASHIGQGISFPLQTSYTGGILLTRGADSIERAMRMIIGTAPGERVMRPDFGCAIWDLLFEPININTLGLMSEAVREAMSRWEPRIEVEDVEVEPDEDRDGQVQINISYTVRATNDRRNLVHPFYLIPGEGDEEDQ
jgi:uncharacterized protein